MLMLSANNVTDFINTVAMKHDNSYQIHTYLKRKQGTGCAIYAEIDKTPIKNWLKDYSINIICI